LFQNETKTERKGWKMEAQTRKYEKYAPISAGTTKEKHKLPLKKFRIGSISATVWENDGKNQDGQSVTFKTVNFERSYKDSNGVWQTTTTLRTGDLPKAALVINKAYEYLLLTSESTEDYER
jgi:hypothetical protein